MIQQVSQFSDQNSRIWFTGVTIAVDATNTMQLDIGGTALVTLNGVQQSFTLDAAIPITADGLNHNIVLCTDGTIVLDPSYQVPRQIASAFCWLTVPIGTTDLNTITINQLVHVQEGS